MNIVFNGQECHPVVGVSENGRISLRLVDPNTFEPIATVTKMVAGVELAENEAIIKSYAEDADAQGALILEALLEAGVITPIIRWVDADAAQVPVCEFTPEFIAEYVTPQTQD